MDYISISRGDDSFQRPLSGEQLKSICVSGLGWDQRVVEIREVATGMFNNTYEVTLSDRKVILRVGPAPDVRVFSNEEFLLRREQAIEPFLGCISELAPRTIHADFSHKLIDRDYVFQTFLPGELWDEIRNRLTPAQIDSLWKQLGFIARQIHTVRGKKFGLPSPKKQFRRWSDAVIGIVRDMIKDIHDLEIDASGTGEYLEALEAGRAILDEIHEPRLCHGDLWPKNVLLVQTGDDARITGLLDSERAFWGDPMAEWIFHDGTCGAAFWESHGDRSAGKSARFRDDAYTGLYAVQLYLEAWRFKQDDAPYRERLRHATGRMREHL
jgi:aminoglycoside phosphotransferase (APT) family kinase protein